MAMDMTDRRLIRGLIWIAVVGVIAYFLPGYGYKAQRLEEDNARADAERIKDAYNARYHPPMTDAHLGRASLDDIPPMPENFELVEVRRKEFADDNATIEEDLETEKARCKMPFGAGDAVWVDVPEREREPGLYFGRMYDQKKLELEALCKKNGVTLSDREIGFRSKYEGLVKAFKREKAEEYLRELYIAESIIRLCVKAKKEQEDEEVRQKVKPEAYMHIISVTPQDSKATGPFVLKRNMKFDEKSSNRFSAKGKRYILEPLPKFIQEYPVEIVLHCDANTFRRFLRSVREPGRFLVIRNLEMISPFLSGSNEDKTELSIIQGEMKKNDATAEKGKKIDLSDQHIGVRLSAAGMDFFDPKEYPKGLYEQAARDAPKIPTGKKRRTPGSGG
jgi:hypothetical protein